MSVEFIKKSACKKIYGVVHNLCRISAEKVAKYKRKHDHGKQGLKERPEHTQGGVSVLKLYIFNHKLLEQVAVFHKICFGVGYC